MADLRDTVAALLKKTGLGPDRPAAERSKTMPSSEARPLVAVPYTPGFRRVAARSITSVKIDPAQPPPQSEPEPERKGSWWADASRDGFTEKAAKTTAGAPYVYLGRKK
jgi:hypothetical protein